MTVAVRKEMGEVLRIGGLIYPSASKRSFYLTTVPWIRNRCHRFSGSNLELLSCRAISPHLVLHGLVWMVIMVR